MTAATKLFQNRFFGREEGGTNVRQVWMEVKLAQALGLGRAGRCEDALAVAKGLGSPVTGLAFTEDGLKEIIDSARTNYLLGDLFTACGQKAEAEKHYQLVAKSPENSQLETSQFGNGRRRGSALNTIQLMARSTQCCAFGG